MEYAFITAWWTTLPVEPVWQAITRVENWPAWWRGVKAVKKVRDGDDRGIESRDSLPPNENRVIGSDRTREPSHD